MDIYMQVLQNRLLRYLQDASKQSQNSIFEQLRANHTHICLCHDISTCNVDPLDVDKNNQNDMIIVFTL